MSRYFSSGVTKLRRMFKPSRITEMDRVHRQISESGLFDSAYYLRQYSDVAKLTIDPLQHYLASGWREDRNPNALFDTRWYLDQYPDVPASGINPLYHYLKVGGFIGRNPSLRFSSKWYLETYNDVREAGVNPLQHFLVSGAIEKRETRPAIHDIPGTCRKRTHYDHWMDANNLSARDLAELEERLRMRAGRMPKISILTPVYDTNRALLSEMVQSVKNQIYADWELCLVDDASTAVHIAPALERFSAEDPRIRATRLSKNSGISVATNAASKMATGEVLIFLDHDDLLSVDCLAEIAMHYADNPESDIVYSDDDKIDVDGRRYAPQFKPDWSPVLLMSWMYIGHVFSVRRSLFESVGGFRSAFDGAQDYDFALRAAEKARRVGHVSKILYHWRAVEGSTATGGDAKPESMNRGLDAVREAIERRGIDADAVFPDWAATTNVGMFDLEFGDDGPSVTIVVPTKDKVGLLKNCLTSLEKTTYRNYNILVADNESVEKDTKTYLAQIDRLAHVRVKRVASPAGKFNFANLNNEAVRDCDTEYVLFLNNDTEVISPGWLSQMMGYAQMPGVGAVGARLYFEDGTLQHAGIVHGHHDGLAGHAFRGAPPHDWGYLGFVRSAREYSGVTAACMLTPRSLFTQLGGFDENEFAVAYNDVDYCYRLVQAGRRCVYCPTAELWHYEGKTRGFNDDPLERRRFRTRYHDFVDRWYNPNLSLDNERFEPATVRPETLSKAPIKLGVVTHNLNNEGAPTTLMDVVIGLAANGEIDPVVFSPADGPLRALYEEQGIKVVILNGVMHGVHNEDTQKVAIAGLGMLLRAFDREVVLANTLQTYWAIRAASSAGLPSVLAQHESEPWEHYYDDLPSDMRPAAYRAFAEAYRVLYVAEATRRAWRPVETRGNFAVIRHGIPPERLAEEVSRWAPAEARKLLDVPAGKLVVTVVGTVCRRKGQLDLIEAYASLSPETRERVKIIIAGKLVDPTYVNEFNEVLKTIDGPDVVLTDHIEDPFLFYAATDIFVCTSRIESAPRVLVEAMACGLPIVTTPVFGIPEMVQENGNALYYEPGDHNALAERIARVIEDPALRDYLGKQSPRVLQGQPGFAEMVEGYGRVIRQASNLEMDKWLN